MSPKPKPQPKPAPKPKPKPKQGSPSRKGNEPVWQDNYKRT